MPSQLEHVNEPHELAAFLPVRREESTPARCEIYRTALAQLFNIYARIPRRERGSCDNPPLSGMHLIISDLIFGGIYESRFHVLTFLLPPGTSFYSSSERKVTADVLLKSARYIGFMPKCDL